MGRDGGLSSWFPVPSITGPVFGAATFRVFNGGILMCLSPFNFLHARTLLLPAAEGRYDEICGTYVISYIFLSLWALGSK